MLKLKVAQVFAKVAQKVVAAVGFSSKMVFYKFAKYLGCFCKKFCHQELSKIAQSGHTDCRQASSYGVARHVLDRSRGCRSRRL